jgi:lipopolysaccharide/colanic/teichoic acid biosynthesis glycosyltransferase
MLGRKVLLRVMDITLALVGLVPLALQAVVYGLIVLATDPGPLLVRHDRIGYGRRPFRAFKFRFIDGQPGQTGFEAARLQRKFGLDETPQIINVLLGQMSFVGPRAIAPEDDDRSRSRIPWWDDRSACRPGLTGLAVACLPYPAGIPYRVAALGFDLDYAEFQSLSLYLSVLWLSARKFRLGHDHRPPPTI